MDEGLLIGRIVLAGVFLVAALAKAADLTRTREAFTGLGVPRAVVPAAAILVPLAELVVAVALIPSATASVAAVAALVLLAAFTALVAVALARGTEAECHCFGNVTSRPVGPGTLVRNAVLLAIAGFVAAGGAGTSATAWIADLTPVETVLAAVSAVLAAGLAFNTAFLFQLFRQNGRLWAELDQRRSDRGDLPAAPAVGEYLPSFQLPDLSGELVELDDLLDGERGLMLLFTSPDCGACDALFPAIGTYQAKSAADPALVLISVGDADTVAAKVGEHGIKRILLTETFDFPYSLGVTGAPGGVIMDPYGRITEEPVLGATALGERIGSQPSQPQLVRVEGGA